MATRRFRITMLLLFILACHVGPARAEKPLVHFGINLRHRPILLYERYQPLMDYLSGNTPYRFKLKVSRNYDEALRDLKEGRTQIASLGDGASMDAMLFHGAMPVVKPLNSDGKPFYRCVIVVQESSPLRRLTDLRGKRIAFGSPHSVSGSLIPRILLERTGIRADELGVSVHLDNHTAAAKAVLKGIVDAGAVKDAFAQRFQGHGLRVLAVSDPIPSAPLLAGAEVPRKLVRSVAKALLKLDPSDPAQALMMSTWDAEFRYGFTSAHPTDYRELFRNFRAVPSGCGTGCHR